MELSKDWTLRWGASDDGRYLAIQLEHATLGVVSDHTAEIPPEGIGGLVEDVLMALFGSNTVVDAAQLDDIRRKVRAVYESKGFTWGSAQPRIAPNAERVTGAATQKGIMFGYDVRDRSVVLGIGDETYKSQPVAAGEPLRPVLEHAIDALIRQGLIAPHAKATLLSSARAVYQQEGFVWECEPGSVH